MIGFVAGSFLKGFYKYKDGELMVDEREVVIGML